MPFASQRKRLGCVRFLLLSALTFHSLAQRVEARISPKPRSLQEVLKEVRISIVTPSLNCANHIEQSILSVRNQETSADIQYVVMDGGSTDGTLDILRKYEDRLTWVSEPDEYHSHALNKAFALCDGDVVAWINADDYYEPGAFEVVRQTFEVNPDASWVAGYYRMVDADGREIRKLQARYKHWLMRHYSYSLLVAENVFAQPSTFYRRGALEKCLPLDYISPNRPAFDYKLWLDLGKVGAPAVVPEVLSNFRYLSDSVTGAQTGKLFKGELNYARREFRTHPFAVVLHHLNWMKIRLVYSWWRW